MTIDFELEANCETYVCGVCRYIYHEYYDREKQIKNEKEPFVKLEEPLLRTVSRDYEPDRIERVVQYACPVCGVLQVDTNSL